MPNMTIENVRISYPKLFKPEQVKGQGDPKFSAAFLIRADNPQLKTLVETAKALTAEKYPKGAPANFKALPLYKGEDKYPGNPDYEGMYVLNTSNKNRPTVVDRAMNKVLDPEAVYPGMVVNVAVSVYVYNNVSKGVSAGLEAVQLVADGERLDSRPAIDELFAPIDVVEDTGAAFDPLA